MIVLDENLSDPVIKGMPDFNTKQKRMGKVISYSDGKVDWYSS